MKTKVCTKCKTSKPISDFYSQTKGLYGVTSQCKQCQSAYSAQRRKTDLDKVREISRKSTQKRRKANPEKARKIACEEKRRWREKEENRVKEREWIKKWAQNNPEKVNVAARGKYRKRCEADPEYRKRQNKKQMEYRKNNIIQRRAFERQAYQANANNICERKKNWRLNNVEKAKEIARGGARKWRKDPKNRLSACISAGIRRALKDKKNGFHWESLVDYTLPVLIKHLKSTLPDGVIWDDYTNNVIQLHIDHIIPVSAFNFVSSTDTDFKKCWALKNLRLIPAIENLSKGPKLDRPFQPSLAGM